MQHGRAREKNEPNRRATEKHTQKKKKEERMKTPKQKNSVNSSHTLQNINPIKTRRTTNE